jgi:hypothetical protein
MTQAACRTENVPVKPQVSYDNLDNICHTLLRSPSLIKQLPHQSRLSYGSVPNITQISKLHPHYTQVMHQLKGSDKEHNFKNAHLHTASGWGIDILNEISFTNESWFHFSG